MQPNDEEQGDSSSLDNVPDEYAELGVGFSFMKWWFESAEFIN